MMQDVAIGLRRICWLYCSIEYALWLTHDAKVFDLVARCPTKEEVELVYRDTSVVRGWTCNCSLERYRWT